MLTINWIENKTSKYGSKYAKATINDNGKEYTDVTIFGTFPGFAELRPGSSVDGTIKIGEYMGKPNYTLEAIKAEKPAYRAGGGVAAAVAKKEASIAKAQENKEQGIKIASTMNKAVEITIAESTGKTGFDFEGRVLYWRQWLWKHWDDEQVPF